MIQQRFIYWNSLYFERAPYVETVNEPRNVSFQNLKSVKSFFYLIELYWLKHCGLMNIIFCPIRFHLAFNFWAKSSDEIVSFPDLLPTMILVRGYVLLTFHFFSCTKFREHILNFMCSCRVFVFTSISGNSNFVLICIASSLNWCYYFI